jgi:hypothetical protein
MRNIALLALISLPLVAGFFPSTVHTSVSETYENGLKLGKPFPVTGMSGIVIHNYGNQLEAITGYIAQVSEDGKAELIEKEIIHHEELPTIKTQIAKGDKVIGGYLYDTILLLAPDADTYAKITKRNSRKKWIHPDLFATFLSKEGDGTPTRENLAKFAKEYQIGLIYIVQHDHTVLLDPISGKIVGKKTFKNAPAKAQFPFFMRFDKIKTGIFSDSGEGDYYQTMEQFK